MVARSAASRSPIVSPVNVAVKPTLVLLQVLAVPPDPPVVPTDLVPVLLDSPRVPQDGSDVASLGVAPKLFLGAPLLLEVARALQAIPAQLLLIAMDFPCVLIDSLEVTVAPLRIGGRRERDCRSNGHESESCNAVDVA